MSNDNTHGAGEPSPASAGSQPVAYEIHWKGQDGKYLAKPYLVFANEQPSEHWTPAPLRVPLYRQPQPTLTDEEREAIHFVVGDVADITNPPEDTLRGLLERLR